MTVHVEGLGPSGVVAAPAPVEGARMPSGYDAAWAARSVGFDGPYSASSLLEIAAALDSVSRADRVHAADAVKFRTFSGWAFACAERMENDGIATLPNVGPFQSVRYERGDRVKILAGAVIKSTKPSLCRVATRAFVVSVHDVHAGYVTIIQRGGEIRNPEVHWAGSGGYWCWTDINSVSRVET